jgi:ribosomal-protein-alanine N-acetyltransferase
MIETERLLLKPLTYQQLQKYTSNDNSLEAELKLDAASRVISAELKEALETTILPNVANTQKNYLFSTLWTIILKSEHKMVGDLCFFGEPNENGEIEIGYGTYENFRGNGYMKEAVGAIIVWASSQASVKTIKASTDKTNLGSSAILQKNNFKQAGETETLINWRISLFHNI